MDLLRVCVYLTIYSLTCTAQIQFNDTGQSLGDDYSLDIELGDLDGDGDLDALVGNSSTFSGIETMRMWINDGSGMFTVGTQTLSGYGLALGDVDGDGDLDVFALKGDAAQANELWLNDGTGHFTSTGQALGLGQSTDVALGDLDGDGDLDAFVARHTIPDTGEEAGHLVWFNDGQGHFTNSGQRLGDAWSNSVDLDDIDGDGDIDALITNNPFGNRPGSRVWLNNGRGIFSLGEQVLTSSFSMDLAIGDLNGDSHPDVFLAHSGSPRENSILFNDGTGQFSDSHQIIGGLDSRSICLGDLNQDGFMDAYIANYDGWTATGPNPGSDEIWINDGTGHTKAVLTLGNTKSMDAQLGDLDGNGDLDVFVVNRGANKVWLNTTPIPDPNGPIENKTTGERFSVIQYAIDRADLGNVIVMKPAIYNESIILNQDIVLQSLDPNDPYYIGGTIIQGDPNESVVTLSENTEFCTLTGLTLRAGCVGISGTSTDATIRNCRIMDNGTHGIELFEGSDPILQHCLITANGQTGITMYEKTGSRSTIYCQPTIEDCVIVQNGETDVVGGEPVILDSIIE